MKHQDCCRLAVDIEYETNLEVIMARAGFNTLIVNPGPFGLMQLRTGLDTYKSIAASTLMAKSLSIRYLIWHAQQGSHGYATHVPYFLGPPEHSS